MSGKYSDETKMPVPIDGATETAALPTFKSKEDYSKFYREILRDFSGSEDDYRGASIAACNPDDTYTKDDLKNAEKLRYALSRDPFNPLRRDVRLERIFNGEEQIQDIDARSFQELFPQEIVDSKGNTALHVLIKDLEKNKKAWTAEINKIKPKINKLYLLDPIRTDLEERRSNLSTKISEVDLIYEDKLTDGMYEQEDPKRSHNIAELCARFTAKNKSGKTPIDYIEHPSSIKSLKAELKHHKGYRCDKIIESVINLLDARNKLLEEKEHVKAPSKIRSFLSSVKRSAVRAPDHGASAGAGRGAGGSMGR